MRITNIKRIVPEVPKIKQIEVKPVSIGSDLLSKFKYQPDPKKFPQRYF
jgi:hypothetical protein